MDERPCAFAALASSVFDATGKVLRRARGMTASMGAGGKRGGTKVETGRMVMFGSHNLIPSDVHKAAGTLGPLYSPVTGTTPSVPALYSPALPVDEVTAAHDHPTYAQDDPHASAGAQQASSRSCRRYEPVGIELAPALAAKRDRLADLHDSRRDHRMSRECSAFSAGVARSYAVTTHDDSGKAAETVQFYNRHGALPVGHKWRFTVGGFVHPLPDEEGKAALFIIEGEGVSHGTLPTSSTAATLDHGNLGSALVTKSDMIESLNRQARRKETTHSTYCASPMYLQ